MALGGLGSRKWTRAVAAALAAACALAVQALDPSRALTQYHLQTWDWETDLPQGSVQTILQTRDGYLWLGTQEGLVRFNGAHFTVVPITGKDATKAPDVRCILEGSDGALWAGTYGSGLYRRGARGVQAFTSADGLAGDTVLSLAQDGEGTIWVGTEMGLTRIVGVAGFTSLRTRDGLPSDTVDALLVEPGGTLWVGTSRGLCRYERGEVVPVPLGAFGEAGILGLYRDRKGRLWVGGRAGVVVLEGGREGGARPVDELPKGEGWCFLEDRDGSFWVGTSVGLCRMRAGAVEVMGREQGLTYSAVRSLLEDAEGSLWVGTTNGGLNQLRDGSFTTLTEREGLENDFVWCVAESPRGGLWVGTDLGGLSHVRNGTVRAYGEAEGIDARQISALEVDADGRVYAGSRMALYVGRDGGPFRRFDARDGLPEGRIRAILSPRSGGGVWLASHGGGLSFFDGKRFKTFTRADGLPDNFVRCLLETRDGALWLGTHNAGVCRYSRGRFEIPPGVETVRPRLVMSLTEDPEGGVWVMDNGQGALLFRDGRWSRFTTQDGLIDDKPFRLLDDGLGSLWITCNRGIVRLSKAALLERAQGKKSDPGRQVFSIADGLRTAECNGGAQPAGCRSRDGRLWFPTAKGLSAVTPGHLQHNPRPPPVLLEEVLVGGERVALSPGALLPPGARDLEFRYAALTYQAASRVRFQYRVEGYDAGWVDAANRHAAYYTTLPPGRYTFRVRACNSDGVWNEQGASFAFRIRPRLLQRWPVRAALALVSVALLYALFRVRVRRMKAREAELEQAVADRTKELHRVNQELERLAATDGLTGLPNHRTFHEHLALEAARSGRSGAPLAVILADIDHFKHYNDSRGHLEGDRALKLVAEALAGALRRPADFAARYGGEEFAFLLPETPPDGARHVAEALRAAVEALGEPHPNSDVAPVLTVSLGVASGTVAADTGAEGLLARADAALYRAKSAGRNRVETD